MPTRFDTISRLQQQELDIRGVIGTVYERIDQSCRSQLIFCLPGLRKVRASLLQEHTCSTRHLERELGKEHPMSKVWTQREDLVIAEAVWETSSGMIQTMMRLRPAPKLRQ